MKVFITGSTGQVGGGVLQECLANPQVTSVVALTRRPLDTKHPKLNNVIHKDYLHYDDSVIEELKGAEACIWHVFHATNDLPMALGSPTSGKTVHIDYTNVATSLCLTHLVPLLPKDKKFRFVYTSGGAIPYLDSNFLFFLGPARKLRGEQDRAVLKLSEDHAGKWESYVARPWSVVPERTAIARLLGENSYIPIPQLGAAMVDAGLNGAEKGILDNAWMKAKGKEILDAREK